MLTTGEKKRALAWYVAGFDLITIAQEFGITAEQLKAQLRNH
jgi:hypothetical protein